MNIITIQARKVKPGDYIYSKSDYAGNCWVRVLRVEREMAATSLEGGAVVQTPHIILHTSAWSTTKHEREAVAVRVSA